MEKLRDDAPTKDLLFRYLALRAKQESWSERFKVAAKRYLQNKADIALFGILVRDVQPDIKDLEKRTTALAKSRPVSTAIGLLAFYLPLGIIPNLAQRVIQLRDARS